MLAMWPFQAGKGWVSKKTSTFHPSLAKCWTFSQNNNNNTWTSSWLLPIFSSQENKSHA